MAFSPDVIIISADSFYIDETPIVDGGPFLINNGHDDHVSSDWEILDDTGTIIWRSIENTRNLQRIQIPEGVITPDREYTFRVRYKGAIYGLSDWGEITAPAKKEFIYPPATVNAINHISVFARYPLIPERVLWEASLTETFDELFDSYSGPNKRGKWLPEIDLEDDNGKEIFVRVKYWKGDYEAEWSNVDSYTVPKIEILTPNVIVSGFPLNVKENAFFQSSGWLVLNGEDVHSTTDWVVEDSNGEVVWSKMGEPFFLYKIDIDKGVLQEDSSYTVKVRNNGLRHGSSDWGSREFPTAKEFTPPILINILDINKVKANLFEPVDEIEWQASLATNFADLVDISFEKDDVWDLGLNELDYNGKTIQVRARYTLGSYTSGWSNTVSFVIPEIRILRPGIISDEDPLAMGETPTFTAVGDFVITNAEDEYHGTEWVILDSAGDNAWTDFTKGKELTIPSMKFFPGQQYQVKARYLGKKYSGFNISNDFRVLDTVTKSSFSPESPVIVSPSFGKAQIASIPETPDSIEFVAATNSLLSPPILGYEGDLIPIWQPEIDYTGYSGRTIYVAMRYQKNSYWSGWSNVVEFEAGFVVRPSVYYFPLTRTIKSSNFSSDPGGDFLKQVEWEVRDEAGEIVWNTVGTSLEVVLPEEVVLNDGETFGFKVRHEGENFGYSEWSETTYQKKYGAEDIVPGKPTGLIPYGGGYYTGINVVADGSEYALVVAPNEQGGTSEVGLEWKRYLSETPNANSPDNGVINEQAIIANGLHLHEAERFCNGLTINGFTDWYLPSQMELEGLHRHLKPTTTSIVPLIEINDFVIPPSGGSVSQTDIDSFSVGSPEAFDTNTYYWSSTQSEFGLDDYAWSMSFSNGHQNGVSLKTNLYKARAVRREYLGPADPVNPVTPKIVTPSVSITGELTYVPQNPSMTGTNFRVINGADTHSSTDWLILSKTGSIIWESQNDGENLTSITLPAATLDYSTDYELRVRYNGISAESSYWLKKAFTTRPDPDLEDQKMKELAELIGERGEFMHGGYYTGILWKDSDDKAYAVIVAPVGGSEEEFNAGQLNSIKYLTWNYSGGNAIPDESSAVGYVNKVNEEGLIGGYSDWLIPNQDQLEICYRAFKPSQDENNEDSNYSNLNSVPLGYIYSSTRPSQTPVNNFKENSNKEEFIINFPYWTSKFSKSSYLNGPVYNLVRNFLTGKETDRVAKSGDSYNPNQNSALRLIRLVPVTEFEEYGITNGSYTPKPEDIGKPIYGGYYAGTDSNGDHIIVADPFQGGSRSTNTSSESASDDSAWAEGLTINDYSDWQSSGGSTNSNISSVAGNLSYAGIGGTVISGGTGQNGTSNYYNIDNPSDTNDGTVKPATVIAIRILPKDSFGRILRVSEQLVREGESVTVEGVRFFPNEDISYTVTGVDSFDVLGISLMGTVQTDSVGYFSVSFSLVNDVTTEGTEILNFEAVDTNDETENVDVWIRDTSNNGIPHVPLDDGLVPGTRYYNAGMFLGQYVHTGNGYTRNIFLGLNSEFTPILLSAKARHVALFESYESKSIAVEESDTQSFEYHNLGSALRKGSGTLGGQGHDFFTGTEIYPFLNFEDFQDKVFYAGSNAGSDMFFRLSDNGSRLVSENVSANTILPDDIVYSFVAGIFQGDETEPNFGGNYKSLEDEYVIRDLFTLRPYSASSLFLGMEYGDLGWSVQRASSTFLVRKEDNGQITYDNMSGLEGTTNFELLMNDVIARITFQSATNLLNDVIDENNALLSNCFEKALIDLLDSLISLHGSVHFYVGGIYLYKITRSGLYLERETIDYFPSTENLLPNNTISIPIESVPPEGLGTFEELGTNL